MKFVWSSSVRNPNKQERNKNNLDIQKERIKISTQENNTKQQSYKNNTSILSQTINE
jgi:hypothetical protein